MGAETRLLRCFHERVGPKVGRNVVAWRQQCKRMVRVPNGVVLGLCWQHRKGGEDSGS